MFESRVVLIRRPLHEVFDFLAHFENDPQWRAELLEIERLGGFPDEAMPRYVQRVHWEGRSIETTFEVSAIEHDRSIEFAGTAEGVTVTGSYAFESAGEDATKVTVSAVAETTGPLNVLEPSVRALVSRQFDRDLEALQTLLNTRAESLNDEEGAET